MLIKNNVSESPDLRGLQKILTVHPRHFFSIQITYFLFRLLRRRKKFFFYEERIYTVVHSQQVQRAPAIANSEEVNSNPRIRNLRLVIQRVLCCTTASWAHINIILIPGVESVKSGVKSRELSLCYSSGPVNDSTALEYIFYIHFMSKSVLWIRIHMDPHSISILDPDYGEKKVKKKALQK